MLKKLLMMVLACALCLMLLACEDRQQPPDVTSPATWGILEHTPPLHDPRVIGRFEHDGVTFAVIEPVPPVLEFDYVGPFRDGIARVAVHANRPQQMSGNFIDDIHNLFIITANASPSLTPPRKYGFIDSTGTLIVPLIYDGAGDFSEGLAAVANENRWGFIDTTGKVVIPFEYDRDWMASRPFFSEGLALVVSNGRRVYIDKHGNEVFPAVYYGGVHFSEGLAAVFTGGERDMFGGLVGSKWGFIDQTGSTVIPLEFDSVREFSEGLAAVEKDGMWGFIDRTGSVVIPFEYDWAATFSEGLVSVGKNGKRGFIDRTGNVVIPFEDDDIAREFREGLAVVYNNSWHWAEIMIGYIDKTGNLAIPFERYTRAGSFSGGLAAVERGWRWGFIDTTGRMVVPFEYDWIPAPQGFDEGLVWVRQDNKWGILQIVSAESVASVQ